MVNGKYFTKLFSESAFDLDPRPTHGHLFALKNSQILKKMLKSPNWKKWKLNEAFSSKNKVIFFHLILWDFEIKNKKGEKKLNFFEFLKKYSFSWMTFVSKFFKIWFGKFWYQNRSQSIWENFPFEKKNWSGACYIKGWVETKPFWVFYVFL